MLTSHQYTYTLEQQFLITISYVPKNGGLVLAKKKFTRKNSVE